VFLRFFFARARALFERVEKKSKAKSVCFERATDVSIARAGVQDQTLRAGNRDPQGSEGPLGIASEQRLGFLTQPRSKEGKLRHLRCVAVTDPNQATANNG
jgi:hypothetical protein